MNLLWLDDFGSFLDSLTADVSGNSAPFAGSDGQALLWSGGITSGGGLTGQDMLWAEPDSSATIWQLAYNAGTAGVPGLGDGNLSFAGASLSSDVGSLMWQTTLFVFEEISATANSTTLDSTLNQILDVVWTATGGAGSPPITLPHAPSNPFADGFPAISLPSSQLVWTGQPPLGTGQPPLTPLAGNSPFTSGLLGPMFSTLVPQQLVWTNPAQSLPAIISDSAAVGAAPITLAAVGLMAQGTGPLPPLSGAGSR
jgi:hypothetical protein